MRIGLTLQVDGFEDSLNLEKALQQLLQESPRIGIERTGQLIPRHSVIVWMELVQHPYGGAVFDNSAEEVMYLLSKLKKILQENPTIAGVVL
jgi:hypothetical protein